MKKSYINIIILLLINISQNIFAQIPKIQKVEALSTYPGNRILISGSGFSNTPAQLQVWFDQVKGNIITSSDYAIEVDVPAQAKLGNVEVINLSSKLSAKSGLKFMPSFNGEPFDEAKFSTSSFTSVQELWDLCSCDLNNDSKPDIISTKFFSPGTDLVILQNTGASPGTLTFNKLDKSNLASLDMTFQTDNVVCGDLQGDGKPDLVVTRSGSPRNSVHILTNTSAGTISFAAPINLLLEVGHLATRSAIKDINADGKPDIIVTNSFNNFLYIFQNQSSAGTLSFNATPIKVAVTGALNTYGIDVQDMDNDGLPDIILNQFQTNDIFILKNKSAGAINFPSVQKITVNGTLNRINSADFNNDQLLDLVITSTVNNKIEVLINTSTASTFSFATPLDIATSTGPWGVDVSDFDGDGDPDIIVANRNQATINVFLHNGNFSSPSFTKKDVSTGKPSRNILAGDFDGDGKPDIAFTSFNTATNSYSLDILRNKNCHQPKILNTTPLVICSGQTIRLNAIPAFNVTFSWKEGSTSLVPTSSYLDITSPGTYTVKATGELSTCFPTSTAVVVTPNTNLAQPDPIITASSPVCTNTTLGLKTDLVPGASYSWKGPNNYTSSLQNPSIPNLDINDAGLYTLQVISAGGCKSNIVSKRIDIVDLGSVSIATTVASNMICNGSNLTLSVPVDADFNYKWYKNNLDASQTTNTLLVTQTGDYKVDVSSKTITGCIRTTSSVNVKVLSQPTSDFALSKTSACKNESITFTDESTDIDVAGTPIYQWNFGDTNTSSDVNPTHSYSSVNTFSPSLTVSYSGVTGCSSNKIKSVTITNSISPVIAAGSEAVCPGESTNLSITVGFTSIVWSNTTTGNATDISDPGNYSVNAFDSNGCPVTDDITIASKEIPVIVITADKTTVGIGSTVQLQASGADTYLWEPTETLSDALIANPVASPLITITYAVTGTLTAGCSASNQIIITVDESKTNIAVPRAFSPNGDGSNDVLIIGGIINYPQCSLNIFDGRGRRIYQTNGDSNEWDGTYQGKPIPDGTYYYVFGCPDSKPVTGSILVFR